jgi:hypothetical protein
MEMPYGAIQIMIVIVTTVIIEPEVIRTMNLELYEVYIKWPGREAHRSPPSRAEVKNGVILPAPHRSSWRGACLMLLTLFLPYRRMKEPTLNL